MKKCKISQFHTTLTPTQAFIAIKKEIPILQALKTCLWYNSFAYNYKHLFKYNTEGVSYQLLLSLQLMTDLHY